MAKIAAFSLIVLAVILVAPTTAAPQESQECARCMTSKECPACPALFLLLYRGRDVSNLDSDKRFHPLLRRSLPDLPATWWGPPPPGKKVRVIDAATDFLDEGGNLFIEEQGGRFVTIPSMPLATGPNFGMLWVDCRSEKPGMIFVADVAVEGNNADLYIYPNTLEYVQNLPVEFMGSLARWLDEIWSNKIVASTVIAPDGKSIPFDMGTVPDNPWPPPQ
jgi:hypothetical protein